MSSTFPEGQKHIAMYIGSLNKGGAERVMCNLAEYFFDQGYKVTMVTTYLADDEYEMPHGTWYKTPCEGCSEIEVLNLDEQKKKVWIDKTTNGISRVFSALTLENRGGRIANLKNRVLILRSIWEKIKPDIILSFLGKNNVMAIKSAKGLGIPVVVSVRSNPSREYASKRLYLAMRHYFPKAAGVVVQTNEAESFFGSNIKTKLLPNSVHPDFINRDVIQFDDRKKEIVSVGRLDDNKNQLLLISAFSKITKYYPDYKLVLYGDGPSREKFKEKAKELGLLDNEKVIFKGNVSDVPDHIGSSEIFVLTSKQEGSPNALIEAMALGLTCISTDCPCGGPRDLITDGENGLLIPMASDEEMVKELANALRRVITDRDFSKKLSENATYVRDKYSPDKINSQWKEYFEEILKK